MGEIHLLETDTMETLIKGLCKRLKVIAVDVDRARRAKELLTALQRRKTFTKLLGADEDDGGLGGSKDLQLIDSKARLKPAVIQKIESQIGDEELTEDPCLVPFDEDRWHNYFEGFDNLVPNLSMQPNENRKCIELSHSWQCDEELKLYLRAGVRCFLLDLFVGTLRENQQRIVQLREAEISVSKEYGFPVVSTIMAKLSPRYQYTGYLSPDLTDKCKVQLHKGCKIVLTANRLYSDRCSSLIIYVNARFLLSDVKEFDYILIGEDIQIMVRSVAQSHINCCVARPGILTSYMPVLFPARCDKFRISYEELEDLTFAREVGLNVIVSNIAGSTEYLDDLENIMTILHCEHMRLYARIVLNEIKGCSYDMNWVAQRYDGFLVELAPPKLPERTPDIMHLCPDAESFIQLAYNSRKPIILDPCHIAEQQLRIDPAHYYYIFYYPDKYLVKTQHMQNAFYFSFLQSAIFDQIPPLVLSKVPYCDSSHTGADSLARAVVIASFEADAAAIVVVGVTTRMVQKIAFFRPKVQIIFVSHMRSAEDFVSIYYNVTMISFRTTQFISHRRHTFRKAIYGLAYLASRKLAKQGDQVILVYNYESGTTFPEKYLIYKFDMYNFANHMAAAMFPIESNMVEQISLHADC